MSDKQKTKNKQGVEEPAVSDEHMAELRRDMRTAKLLDWVRTHQQQMIAAAVGLFFVVLGSSLWVERISSQRESAATLYHQALDTRDTDQKRTFLHTVVKEFSDSTYAMLALMQLSILEGDKAVQHLIALLKHPRLTDELKWQALLDLAGIYLRQGDKKKARELLEESVGANYEQLRQYLLAEATDDPAEKIGHYRKALNAVSLDANLKQTIEKRLAKLQVPSKPGE